MELVGWRRWGDGGDGGDVGDVRLGDGAQGRA
jgi:hypothetical protein